MCGQLGLDRTAGDSVVVETVRDRLGSTRIVWDQLGSTRINQDRMSMCGQRRSVRIVRIVGTLWLFCGRDRPGSTRIDWDQPGSAGVNQDRLYMRVTSVRIGSDRWLSVWIN